MKNVIYKNNSKMQGGLEFDIRSYNMLWQQKFKYHYLFYIKYKLLRIVFAQDVL